MKFWKKIKIKELITYNFWLKLASLIIAIIVWLYVSGEITKGVKI
ncbi:MAG: hypothetical protein Q8O30_01190 [Candidatus Omnitrophota bacterium]|nr:hypothetical protein [Candidatus Omnitrophota bacterium]